MLVLLPLMLVYTLWALKQLNYLSVARTLAVFFLSFLTLPVYYVLTSFLVSVPFFIMIFLFYFGYQWVRGYFASQLNERTFKQHLHTLTLNSQDADAHYQLGLIHLKRGNLDVARRYFENALKIDPAIGWDAEWVLAKAYYQTGRYEDSLKMSQTALDAAKDKAPQIALLVAQCLTAVGKYGEAEATLRASSYGERLELPVT